MDTRGRLHNPTDLTRLECKGGVLKLFLHLIPSKEAPDID